MCFHEGVGLCRAVARWLDVRAGGMGMGPLNAMHQMGMRVFYASGYSSVKDVLQAYIDGRLQEFGSGNLCRGGCGHHA